VPTLSALNVPTPKSWDEFEDITLSALQIRWSNTELYRNGRQGQRQDGVDIYGNDSVGDFVGVQCKNTTKKITKRLVLDEVLNAESFTPSITKLIVATSAHRDATLQMEVRDISESRKSKGLFSVSLLFWDDICSDLAEDEDKFFKHYPQLKPKQDKALEHDQQIFKELIELLPSNGVIDFLDKNNMAGFAFRDADLDSIRKFSYEWHVADKEFIDSNLEHFRNSLYEKTNCYLDIISTQTWSLNASADLRSVPSEWEFEQPERFKEVVSHLHNTAGEIVEIHQKLVRRAKEHFNK